MVDNDSMAANIQETRRIGGRKQDQKGNQDVLCKRSRIIRLDGLGVGCVAASARRALSARQQRGAVFWKIGLEGGPRPLQVVSGLRIPLNRYVSPTQD